MAKKHPIKKTHAKTVKHYIQLYFVTVAMSAFVFILGNLLFQPQPCANSKSCTSDLAEKIENGAMGVFAGKEILAPHINLAYDKNFTVLGTKDAKGEKHIYVDLANQKLYAYEGKEKIFETLVSTGRWGKTPVGNFHIWHKVRSTRMSGGEGNDAYDLPNVPFVMFFYGDFGLHGAYWHDNYGHTMSHGCVNMRPIDAEVIYNWSDGPEGKQKGTPVSVCEEFTGPDNCVQTNPINK
jgi:hypothetical protein